MKIKSSIGTKFISLTIFVLLFSTGITTYNALFLFEKDNYNNILSSTDAITTAKASEVRSVLSNIINKSLLIGKSLYIAERETTKRKLFNTFFKKDEDFLSIQILKKSSGDFDLKESRINSKFFSDFNMNKKKYLQIIEKEEIDFDRVTAGKINIQPSFALKDIPIVRIYIPFVKSSDNMSFEEIIVTHYKSNKIIETFRESGIYTIYLVNGNGDLLAHPNEKLAINSINFSSKEIVKKMINSSITREFTEYMDPINKLLMYGAYSKVGVADIGVITEVAKNEAFAASKRLIRRSVMVTIIIFFISFLLAFTFSRRLTSPLSKLTKATSLISEGNFETSIDIKSNDEIGNLALSFNHMSIELDKRQKEIEQKIQRLYNINESTKNISANLEIKSLLNYFLKSSALLLKAKSTAIWVYKKGKLTYNAKNNYKDNIDPQKIIQMLSEKKAPIVNKTKEGVVARIFLPLRDKNEIFGFLYVCHKSNETSFNYEDIFVGETVLTSLSITLKNIELLHATAQKARMEKELETAKLVQDTLFPQENVHFKHFELTSYYTPASECGGDWWGFFEINDDELAIMIADATGHGVPAALITATAKSSCSTIEYITKHNAKMDLAPSKLLKILNQAIYDSAKGQILMTFFIGILNKKTGQITYANAGHNPPYIYQGSKAQDKILSGEKGSKKLLTTLHHSRGSRLGQDPNSEYEDAVETMAEGDTILFFTDGFPEGVNQSNKQYGINKFFRTYIKHVNNDIQTVKKSLVDDFYTFTGDTPLVDDLTMVVGRVKNA